MHTEHFVASALLASLLVSGCALNVYVGDNKGVSNTNQTTTQTISAANRAKGSMPLPKMKPKGTVNCHYVITDRCTNRASTENKPRPLQSAPQVQP